MTEHSDILQRATMAISRHTLVKEQLAADSKRLAGLESEEAVLQAVQGVVQAAAQATQEQVQRSVSSVSTLALQAIFDESYQMNLYFEPKRGGSEASITLSRGELEDIDPMNSSGGGVVDVCAFGLRIAMWKLGGGPPVFLMDEPFRFVSKDLQAKVSETLKQISDKVGAQMIIVTHEEELANEADKTFHVALRNGKSIVVED